MQYNAQRKQDKKKNNGPKLRKTNILSNTNFTVGVSSGASDG